MIFKKWSVVFLLIVSLSNSQFLYAMSHGHKGGNGITRSRNGSSVSSDDPEMMETLLTHGGETGNKAVATPHDAGRAPSPEANGEPTAFYSALEESAAGASEVPAHPTTTDVSGQPGTELQRMGDGPIAAVPAVAAIGEPATAQPEREPGCCGMCWETFKHCPTATADVCWRNRTPRQQRWIKIGLWTAGEIGASLATQKLMMAEGLTSATAAVGALRDMFTVVTGHQVSTLTAHAPLAYQFLTGCLFAAADGLLATYDVLGKYYPKGAGVVLIAAIAYLASVNANKVGVINGLTTNHTDFEERSEGEQQDFIDQMHALDTYAETGEFAISPCTLKRWCQKNLEVFGKLADKDQDLFIRLFIKAANAANNRSTLTKFLRDQRAIVLGIELEQKAPISTGQTLTDTAHGMVEPLHEITSNLLTIIAKNFPEYDLWSAKKRVLWASVLMILVGEFKAVYDSESRYNEMCKYLQGIDQLPKLPTLDGSAKNAALWILYGITHEFVAHNKLSEFNFIPRGFILEFKKIWDNDCQLLIVKTLSQILDLIQGNSVDDIQSDLVRCLKQPELTAVHPAALLAAHEHAKKSAAGNEMAIAGLPQVAMTEIPRTTLASEKMGCCDKISQAWASASQHTRDAIDTVTLGALSACCNVIEGLFSGGSEVPLWSSKASGKTMGEILEEYNIPKKLAVATVVGLADYFFVSHYLGLFPSTGLFWLSMASFDAFTARKAYYKALGRDVLPDHVKKWPLGVQYVAAAAQNGLVEGSDITALQRQAFVDFETWSSEKRRKVSDFCEGQLRDLGDESKPFDGRAFKEGLMHLAAEIETSDK